MEEGKLNSSALMCAILRAEYLLSNDWPKIAAHQCRSLQNCHGD
jgi:hypothetical protein